MHASATPRLLYSWDPYALGLNKSSQSSLLNGNDCVSPNNTNMTQVNHIDNEELRSCTSDYALTVERLASSPVLTAPDGNQAGHKANSSSYTPSALASPHNGNIYGDDTSLSPCSLSTGLLKVLSMRADGRRYYLDYSRNSISASHSLTTAQGMMSTQLNVMTASLPRQTSSVIHLAQDSCVDELQASPRPPTASASTTREETNKSVAPPPPPPPPSMPRSRHNPLGLLLDDGEVQQQLIDEPSAFVRRTVPPPPSCPSLSKTVGPAAALELCKRWYDLVRGVEGSAWYVAGLHTQAITAHKHRCPTPPSISISDTLPTAIDAALQEWFDTAAEWWEVLYGRESPMSIHAVSPVVAMAVHAVVIGAVGRYAMRSHRHHVRGGYHHRHSYNSYRGMGHMRGR